MKTLMCRLVLSLRLLADVSFWGGLFEQLYMKKSKKRAKQKHMLFSYHITMDVGNDNSVLPASNEI